MLAQRQSLFLSVKLPWKALDFGFKGWGLASDARMWAIQLPWKEQTVRDVRKCLLSKRHMVTLTKCGPARTGHSLSPKPAMDPINTGILNCQPPKGSALTQDISNAE